MTPAREASEALEAPGADGPHSPGRIRRGLACEEFLLAYQPKVDMRRGTVVGVEALIRWAHPSEGLLQPDAFIPHVENDAVIETLADWAIGCALDQAVAWLDADVALSISVNISPRDLLRDDFVARLEAQLARHDRLRKGTLELEVLESTAVRDPSAVARAIERCRALGVPVLLDDFGTGYSSLTYLRQLPVSAIKLDQSFVRGILKNAADRAIVRGLLVMAEGLGLGAIAEGVESVDHGRALLGLGCALAQGYGIAKPLAPDEVPSWIAAFEAAPPWGRAPG